MRQILRSTAKAAAVLVALAACGQIEDNRSSNPNDPGDIRGVEELGQALTKLNAADSTFVASSGKLTVTLGASETVVVVSRRAADSAILLNGYPVADTLGATFATASNVKWIVLTVGAAGTTVIFDYYNGTFAPGIAPVSPALFGASAGTQVVWGSYGGGSFKIRGSNSSTVGDTIYVGQDAAVSHPGVLISFSATNPDLYITYTGTVPSLGFSLGAGNDTFDATNAKGKTNKTLTFPVTVHGGVGNDTLIGGSGADTLYGDEDVNTIDESTTPQSHTADTVYGLTTTAASGHTYNWTTVTYANWDAGTGIVAEVVALPATVPDTLVVTDHIDTSVGVIIGSPVNDTLECAQATDVPCILWGGAGDDMLIPGASANNTEYLYGGDGNDTFKMNTIGNKVWIAGGNPTDITTAVDGGSVKNLYVDAVDYSGVASVLSSTISMNAVGPSACNTTDGGVLPCPGNVDSTLSGIAGKVNTSIRNDVTVAKCPLAGGTVACTVKANNNGDTIWSGQGSDILNGGTGDDTFVLVAPVATTEYTAGTQSKVVTGGGGNDTADFSQRNTAVTINLDCAVSTCANSGNPAMLATTATAAHGAADTQASTIATLYTTMTTAGTGDAAEVTSANTAVATAVGSVDTAYTSISGATENDTAAKTAADAITSLAAAAATGETGSVMTAVGAAATAVGTAKAAGDTHFTAPTTTGTTTAVNNAVTAENTDATAVTTAITNAATANTALATQLTTLNTAIAAYQSGTDDAGLHTALQALVTAIDSLQTKITTLNGDAASIVTDINTAVTGLSAELTTQATMVSESISLVNINNAVCEPSTANAACMVTSNGNSDEIDFNGDANGSSLTCNSSSVITINAQNLTSNCGT